MILEFLLIQNFFYILIKVLVIHELIEKFVFYFKNIPNFLGFLTSFQDNWFKVV